MKDIFRNIGRVMAVGGMLLLPACGNTEITCVQDNHNERVQVTLPLGREHPFTGTLAMEFKSKSLATGEHQVSLNQFLCPKVLALLEIDQETGDLIFSGVVYLADPKTPDLKWGSYKTSFDFSKPHSINISWNDWTVDKIILDKGSEAETQLPNMSGGSIA